MKIYHSKCDHVVWLKYSFRYRSEAKQVNIKGTVSRDFLLLVFFMNQFLPHPRVCHLDHFEFFRKFAEIFASQGAPPVSTTPVEICHRCQRDQLQNCRRYQRHRWQICHRYQQHRRQIVTPFSLSLLTPGANLPPVSTIPAANFPPVSTTPVANCDRYEQHRGKFATGVVDTGGCAADFSLLNLPKGKSLGRSKPATNS